MPVSITLSQNSGNIYKIIRDVERAFGDATQIVYLNDDDSAAYILFPMTRLRRIQVGLREVLSPFDVDFCIQQKRPTRSKLFLADMEATIIKEEMLVELAKDIGISTKMDEITERAMRGEIDFAQSLVDRTAFLKGVKAETLEASKQHMTLTPHANTLVKTLKNLGTKTVLVSGGFGVFADHVQALCGFDHVYCNHAEMKNGSLTGHLIMPIFNEHGKLEILNKHANTMNIGLDDISAIGDGANDIHMLSAAGLSANYLGKPIVAEVCNLSIKHTDMRMMLYAQGISASEFV